MVWPCKCNWVENEKRLHYFLSIKYGNYLHYYYFISDDQHIHCAYDYAETTCHDMKSCYFEIMNAILNVPFQEGL